MTKRRASMRGRGAEILFGEPADFEIEPRASSAIHEPKAEKKRAEAPPEEAADAPAAAKATDRPPAITTVTDEEDLEKALRAEALDGAPRTRAHGEAMMLDFAPPITPETEVASIEEAYGSPPPPEPAVQHPSTADHVPDSMHVEDVAMYDVPPTVQGATSGAVPPRPERHFFETEEPGVVLSRDIQESEKPANILILPERPLTPEERAEILERIDEGWIADLEARIDSAYENVRQAVGENETVAVDAYNMLLKARDILVLRKVDQLAQAEYYLELVQARLKRVSASESAAKKYQWRILAWGLVWGIAFLAVLILLGQDWFRNIVAPAGTDDWIIDLDIFMSAMLWGGVGGAVAVLYSLFKHVGGRDFDSQFLISYIGKPFLGLISGAIIYMAFGLVIALGTFFAGIEMESGDIVPAVAPGVVYLMALAAGFKETRLLTLIDTLWDQVFGGKKDTEENESEIVASAG